MITLEQVKKHPLISEYIKQSERTLSVSGYTEHGLRHSELIAERAGDLALKVGLNKRDAELAAIAAYCHDMGNFMGRKLHHYFSALLFSQIFHENCDPHELTIIMQAIANHDREELDFTNNQSAIVVLADKSDVHQSRVVNHQTEIDKSKMDIHDRVNYAVTNSRLKVNSDLKKIILTLEINTDFVPIMEYFEIFTKRMVYCRKAAKHLGYKFGLIINNFKLL